MTKAITGVQLIQMGDVGTAEFQILYLDPRGRIVSPWNQIPLISHDKFVHNVCCSPRGQSEHLEVSQDEPWNPLRMASGNFASFSSPTCWNHGIIPQTLGDEEDRMGVNGGIPGDGRPLESIDIGLKKRTIGELYVVKPLSAFAVMCPILLQVTWIIVTIAADDPWVTELEKSSDFSEDVVETLDEIREWLRVCYPNSTGYKENLFGFNERAVCQEQTMSIISASHESWRSRVWQSPPNKSVRLNASCFGPCHRSNFHPSASDSCSDGSASSSCSPSVTSPLKISLRKTVRLNPGVHTIDELTGNEDGQVMDLPIRQKKVAFCEDVEVIIFERNQEWETRRSRWWIF